MKDMNHIQGLKNSLTYCLLFCLLIMPMIIIGCSGEEEIIPVKSDNNGESNGDPNAVYYSDIKTLLDAECATAGCHGGPNPSDGLDMETYEEILIGSSRGPVVISGDAQSSPLYRTTVGTSLPFMPIGVRLDQAQIDSIGKWIDDSLLDER